VKKLYISIFLFTICISSYSQIDIVSTFNVVDIGRNAMLSIKKDFGQHSFLLGVKYHINKKVHDNQNNVFRKRFYATDLGEHLGLGATYQYNFSLKNSMVKPFLFYDFQFTNSRTRNVMVLPYAYMPDGKLVYEKILDYFGPTMALEHIIGVGFSVNLNKRLFLYQRLGGGIVHFINVDWRKLGAPNWEFGSLITVGLGYHLNWN
jgi:hypothetical protein